jgi:hypothetical protein
MLFLRKSTTSSGIILPPSLERPVIGDRFLSMLKWLILATMLRGCSLWVPEYAAAQAIPAQVTSPNALHENTRNDKKVDQPPQDPQSKPTTGEETTEKSLPRFIRSEWVTVYVTLAYVVIALLTLRAIERQAEFMRSQTELLARQTQNTSDSLNFFMNAERARMTMVVKEMGRSFSIDAENTGRAIAKVTYARGQSLILPFGESLPVIPPYLSEKKPDGDFAEWVHSGSTIDLLNDNGNYGLLADLSDESLCGRIRDKQVVLWVFGRVCYGDGISPEERETRFCYEAYVEKPLNTYLPMGGPPIYRLET